MMASHLLMAGQQLTQWLFIAKLTPGSNFNEICIKYKKKKNVS